ncbi:MAG: cytosine deaminase, partial [Paracoccaceae bacterium]|nr:cytosine deaminase [Paracoccaceae bacterium]
MSNLLIKNAQTRNQTKNDILIQNGIIKDIAPTIEKSGVEVIDALGHFICPPFVDSHFHLDATLSYGLPRVNQSGTLLEGIKLWGELKPHLTIEALKNRARNLCHWAIARGTLAIRSHVDISDPSLLAVEAMLEVKHEVKEWIDLQLVAFPQDGLLRANSLSNLLRALDMGIDVVGGIPHFERTMSDGAESIKILCEIAEKRSLRIDMHCDESDDPMSRHIETLCSETLRLGLNGRVAGSHLTSMHSMDNYFVSKLLPLMHESNISVIANPLINITLQGRHDTYPKRRGMTRVPEQMNAGLNVAFGHDCVMDPWYPLGSHDMLDVAHMALHVAQMTGQNDMERCFDAVTTNPAKILGLENYGLEKGCKADLVILQCSNA